MTRLKTLRLQNNYTQEFVATKLKIKQNTYCQYENGQREIPINSLIQLAFLYDTSVDYIIGITEEESPYPRS